jgi:hypothetical protein
MTSLKVFLSIWGFLGQEDFKHVLAVTNFIKKLKSPFYPEIFEAFVLT